MLARIGADILEQLAKSGAKVNFNQGVDIRMMTEDKAEALCEVNTEMIHFAWDRHEDKDLVLPKLELFKRFTKLDHHRLMVYVLCNFDTTVEQDLERIYAIRDLGYDPYVMIYNKERLPRGHQLFSMARWCNSKFIFHTVDRFEDYSQKGIRNGRP